MKAWDLKVILKSDFCTATGEGIPGIANIKTALEHGIPYIPAKRMKGCLLEAAKEMRDNGLVEQRILSALFGAAGAGEKQGIYISDARLFAVPEYLFEDGAEGMAEVEDYGKFLKAVRDLCESEEIYLEEFFTRKRTRTAIDKNLKTASKHSLRTIQVVPAGIVFVSRIEGELPYEAEKVLQNCVKGIRHIGIGITRGLGEVQCVLEEVSEETKTDAEKISALFDQFQPEQEVMLTYEITLNAPVVADGLEAGGCLAAGAVLGALAGMYIKKFSLGQEAHKNEDFSRIFLQNEVTFGYGFLKEKGRAYTPCPKAIVAMKDDKSRWFYTGRDQEGKRRKEIQGLVSREKEKLYQVFPRKEIHFHHARPVDRGIGHALNDRAEDTSSPTGEFFQYVALSKGQTYEGTWKGRKKDIEILMACLQDHKNRLRLGKSKTAEYGDSSFQVIDVSAKRRSTDPLKGRTQWVLWLLSPMLYQNEEGGGHTLELAPFKKELADKLGCGIKELKKVACSYTVYSGYNSRWRLPLVSCPAFAAGSTFFLETSEGISSEQVERCSWGALTGRGCGQLKAEPVEAIGKGIIERKKIDRVSNKGIPEKLEAGELFNRIMNVRKDPEEIKKATKMPESLCEM